MEETALLLKLVSLDAALTKCALLPILLPTLPLVSNLQTVSLESVLIWITPLNFPQLHTVFPEISQTVQHVPLPTTLASTTVSVWKRVNIAAKGQCA